ncbi:hypothetical protein [Paraburkholderia sacchari]|uniref:hypothetical protein n=1 Tax=Paraburkholderia sacchari TaxID=159450 RepID=UPI0039A6B548
MASLRKIANDQLFEVGSLFSPVNSDVAERVEKHFEGRHVLRSFVVQELGQAGRKDDIMPPGPVYRLLFGFPQCRKYPQNAG